MSESRRAIDVSDLPHIAFGHRSTIWWGTWSFMVFEGMMFAAILAAYFYARLSMDVWPPPETVPPGALLPTIELIVLLASVLPAHWATQASIANDPDRVRRTLLLNLALAVLALVLRAVAWVSIDFTWDANVYGSLVWALLCIHTYEYVAAMGETLGMIGVFRHGRFGDKPRLAVEVDSLTWYFVVASWVPIYFVIYLAHHVV